ncbi:MAG: HD-GYP domain-containing protein [Spirochaetia bacterium]|nr:HD-GYP domain-containing protein [Spirochaetota bacterium]MDW8112477.1 HD-GYP domain-containing protein [Spirochaetia bacterium]
MDDGKLKHDIVVDFLRPGMVLSGDLFSKEGVFLWSAKKPLTQDFINQLKSLGIKELYYTKEVKKDLSEIYPPMFSDEVKENAKEVINNVIRQLRDDKKIEIQEVKDIIEQLFKEMIHKLGKAVINLSVVKNYDEYTYTHSINVTILSMFFAKFLGASDFVIKEIGMGAILHDIGKVKIPTTILYKPGELTEEELTIMKKHPIIGYFAIKDEPTVSTYAKKIVLFHHERYDGNGYPLGIKFDRIGRYPQIVSLADVFDALTSERPYKPGISIAQALDIIMRRSGSHFEPMLTQRFVIEMSKLYGLPSPYAIGSFVLLNTGEKGVIIQKDSEYSIKPTIVIVENSLGKVVGKMKVNLQLDPHRYIVKVITEVDEIDRLKILLM